MIEVTIKRKAGHIKSFMIKGHAGSGPYGHDLVCAAVSAISIGAVNAVLSLCEMDLLIDQAGDEGGFLEVTIPDNQEDENASLLFEGMLVSLETVEQDYGQFISISEK
ncbi:MULTISPECIES: ribosomal-processing cysteine protease Prp [Gracilibacillus]|uniref:Ribosomal processing cysteine protease Prp n=1 Tax=Gracilibacillus dipsosauri TaxID=178340 RepID=A0A317KXY2_9BACI|nr:ribosomal-processing cysteine protease Prp [Gracilibacillus dipsosauri]PWU68347.1 ribosomal-processing cysteine protease Prp [Gracilibacillus dipsosauri]